MSKKMTDEQMDEALSEALGKLTIDNVTNAKKGELQGIYECMSQISRKMYQEMFRGECTMEQFGLVMVSVGITALAAAKAREKLGKTELKLDLSALEKLKK